MEAVRRRLKRVVTKDLSNIHGPILIGTIQNPTADKIPPMPDGNAQAMLQVFAEIKTLLFWRQLLSSRHAYLCRNLTSSRS